MIHSYIYIHTFITRSARLSNSKRLPPNEISVKRNDLLARRRQSIIDNKIQRAQFGTSTSSTSDGIGNNSPSTSLLSITGDQDAKRGRVMSMMCKYICSLIYIYMYIYVL